MQDPLYGAFFLACLSPQAILVLASWTQRGEERSEEGGLGSHRAGALPIPSLVLGLLWRGWGVVIGHVKNVSQGPQQSSTTLPPRRGQVRVEGCLVSLEVGGEPLGTDL